MVQEVPHFRLCSSCRRPLDFGTRYYTCSVSTCNRVKMPLTFCSVACFQAHVPTLRHRDAWAEEKRAPSFEAWEAERTTREEQERLAEAALTRQRSEATNLIERFEGTSDNGRFRGTVSNQGAGVFVRASSVERQAATATGWKPAASKELAMSDEVTKEVLVVVSKVKTYIRTKSGMNTSDAVTEALSELVRSTCDQAVERAKSEGRKTVMARDISIGATETEG
jgi:histone H3/H4